MPRSTDEQCYRGVARRTSAFETISCSRKYPCPADVVLRAGRWSTETARLSFDVNANQQPAHLSRWRTRTLSKSTRHFSRDLQNAAGSKKAIRDIDAQIGQRIREARQAQGWPKRC